MKNKMTSQARPSLGRNAISNWMMLGIKFILGFLVTPFLLRALGNNDYGIWVLIGSIVGIFGLLDLGIGSAIMRYMAFYRGIDDPTSIRSLFNSSLLIFSIIGGLCVLAGYLLPHFFGYVLNIPESKYEIFKVCLGYISLSTGINFISNVYQTSIKAYEHYIQCNVVKAIIETLRVLLIVFFVKAGWGVRGVCFSALLTEICGFALFYLVVRLLCKDISINPRYISVLSLGNLISFGIPAAVTILGEILRTRIDNFVISNWVGYSFVTPYSIGVKLATILLELIVAISSVLDPRFSALISAKRNAEAYRLYVKALVFTTSLAYSIGVSLILIGKPLLRLWVGEGFESSFLIMVVMIFGYMAACSQMPTISLLFALNQHRFCAMLAIIEGLANLGLSIFLAKRIGTIGVAVGTAIPMVVCKLFILPYYVKKHSKVAVDNFFSAFLKPIAFICVCATGIIMLTKFETLSWIQVILTFSASIICLLLFTNFVIQSPQNRITILEIKRFLRGAVRQRKVGESEV